jgi:hypothetical protein
MSSVSETIFYTSWQKQIASNICKQNVIWCFLSQMLARARQRISPSRARFAGQRAVCAQFAFCQNFSKIPLSGCGQIRF